mgnify:CR=1 FL=1
MSWTLCTSGAAILKAGTHANSTIIASGASLAIWSTEAEGRIEAETRRTWVANYSTLLSGAKGILADVCSSLIAMNIIAYDTTGYLTREADTLLNVNDEKASRGLAILKDFESHTFKTP